MKNMSDESTKEHLSALMDGELDDAQESLAAEQLTRDVVLRHHWARYHLVRDVLRRDLESVTGLELTSRVSQRLASEPLHLGRPRKKTWSVPWAPIGGLALAASVAVVAIVGVGNWNAVDEPTHLADMTPTSTTFDIPLEPADLGAVQRPEASLVSAVTPPIVWVNHLEPTARLSRLQWDAHEPGVEDRLNAYLVSHSEYLGNGMRGMLPYARIVGYDGRQ